LAGKLLKGDEVQGGALAPSITVIMKIQHEYKYVEGDNHP
jgi:hypothetical protein